MVRPDELNLSGIRRPIKQHISILQTNLLRLYRLRSRHSIVAEICMKIMECKNGGSINLEPNTIGYHEKKEITNDFGECMVPIWAIQGLIPGIKPHDYCLYEKNNQFWDLQLWRGKEVFCISVKTKGNRTNLLKPEFIVREIEGNGDLYFKWNNEVPYRVIETLAADPIIIGPIKAVMKYYPSIVKVSQTDLQNVIRQLTKADAVLDNVPESIMKLISDDDTALEQYEKKEEVTAKMINFIFEKLLIKATANDTRYNELFIDANNQNVHILKFDFDLGGKVSYSLESPKNAKGAVLRSKNGIGRVADKMGLTIP